MRRATLITLVGAASLAVAGLVAWPGCASVPYKSGVRLAASYNARELRRLKAERVSRDELTKQLGAPPYAENDNRLVCYELSTYTKQRIWLLFFVLPISVSTDGQKETLAVFEFDDGNHVAKLSFIDRWDGEPFKRAISEWKFQQKDKR